MMGIDALGFAFLKLSLILGAVALFPFDAFDAFFLVFFVVAAVVFFAGAFFAAAAGFASSAFRFGGSVVCFLPFALDFAFASGIGIATAETGFIFGLAAGVRIPPTTRSTILFFLFGLLTTTKGVPLSCLIFSTSMFVQVRCMFGSIP